jgi:uncharacterized C2H2 Zn-finger protein
MQPVYRCPECGREFPTQEALNEHVNREHVTVKTGSEAEDTAGGERQEECPACSVEFPTAESLREHERMEHTGAASGG